MTEPTVIPYLCNDTWSDHQYNFYKAAREGYAIKLFKTLDKFLEHIKENSYPLLMINLGVAPGGYNDEVIEKIMKKTGQKKRLYHSDYAEIGLHAIEKTKELSDAPILLTSDCTLDEYNKKAEELGVSKVLNILTEDFEAENIATIIKELLAK